MQTFFVKAIEAIQKARSIPYRFEILYRSFFATLPLRFLGRAYPSTNQATSYSGQLATRHQEIRELAEEAHSKFGVFPLSYGIPTQRKFHKAPVVKSELVSQIIPGHPYVFKTEQEYLGEYSKAFFALTMKKAGWDALRHLEIVSQGALPIFWRARKIPKFTLIHWPKPLLEQIEKEYRAGALAPFSEEVQANLEEYAHNHLTAEAMVEYVLNLSGSEKNCKMLFLDKYTQSKQDYHSIFTLLGLLSVNPDSTDILYPPEYLYSSYQGSTDKLYGLGFSYARRLQRSFEQDNRFSFHRADSFLSQWASNYDLIVVGSFRENPEIVGTIIQSGLQSKTVFIYGHDLPPSRKERAQIKKHGLLVFAREIY